MPKGPRGEKRPGDVIGPATVIDVTTVGAPRKPAQALDVMSIAPDFDAPDDVVEALFAGDDHNRG